MPTTSMLQKTLIEEGYDVLVIADYQGDIFKKASDINPDIIIVNVEAADEEMLTQLKYINDAYPKPVVIFSENGDDKIINSAVQAGVSSFIVDGLSKKRIKPVLNVALARFKNHSTLQSELTKTKETLANRKIIEQAKGLVMKQKKCTEDEAYNALRKLAMDRNQKLNDVAKNVLEFSSLLM